ncbi:major facilitator superfamily domain-containing protein [Boletus reticuloceps]|uniref:Major facilitator superfamily domain-containing protein n=1 Tax=Boletus reticuloceps TaxID=495285 RepID=A0A8I3A7U2_9AGAM|nr:major facilitator superfamily domain-containing protein [Boletus reticuloceps]
MQLDRITTDPIISTENTAFTPSHSRPPVEHLPLASEVALPSEWDPLVGAPRPKKPFYRARPLWLVPFALTASITRGMTLASRVEVFTELSCRQLHNSYNHTSTPDVRGNATSVYHQVDTGPTFPPLYLLVPPPARSLGESEGDGILPCRQTAARLQTIMTTIMGTLSALTTGWWGHFGERYGRTRVLAISTLGLFLTDLAFILVSTPRNPLAAHSHKLLILAPIIEGSLGGWSSLTGANTAYIADCTSPGSRATIFARFTGVLFVGLALGPIIGAWLIRNPIPFLKVGQADHPLQSVNSVFWVAICGSFVNLLLVLFVFPESLPASRRAMNRKGKHRAIEGDEIGTSGNHAWVVMRVVKSFISPLSVFLPTDVPVISSVGMPGQLRTRKDWSLTFLALSLFVYTLASGLFQLKYLYAEHVYDWAAEQLSYYISFMGAVRAFHLLVLLPSLLITFKPVRAAVSSAVSNPNGIKAKPKPTKKHLFSEIRFDLLVVRCSMFVDFCSHALVALSPLPSNNATSSWRSQFMFVGATSLACAGAGVMPAAQSLALCTLQGRKMTEKEATAGDADMVPGEQDAAPELGKLFGAMSVLQAVGQTILGPILFGVIYSNTVASFPKAIFAVAGFLVIVAVFLTAFVRPDVSLSMLRNTQKKKRKYTAATRKKVEERRGRSTVRKDLRGGSASASYGAVRYSPSISSASTRAGTSGYV